MIEFTEITCLDTGKLISSAFRFYKTNFKNILLLLSIPVIFQIIMVIISLSGNPIITIIRMIVLLLILGFIEIQLIVYITSEKCEEKNIIQYIIKRSIVLLPRAIVSIIVLLPLLGLLVLKLFPKTYQTLSCCILLISFNLFWYLNLRFLVLLPELLLSKNKIISSFIRVWKLTKDKVWQLFGVLFVTNLIPVLSIQLPIKILEGLYKLVFSESTTLRIIFGILNDINPIIILPYSTFILIEIYYFLLTEEKIKDKAILPNKAQEPT